MPCVPLTSASPSFAASSSGASPSRASASAAGSAPSAVEHLDPGRSAAARGTRAARGLRTPPGSLAPAPPGSRRGSASRPSARRSRRRTPEWPSASTWARSSSIARDSGTRQVRPDRGRVRHHDAVLQRRCVCRVDPSVGERAEAGGDAVDRGALGDGALDHAARSLDAAARAVAERDGSAVRDPFDVVERERVADPHRFRHAPKATGSRQQARRQATSRARRLRRRARPGRRWPRAATRPPRAATPSTRWTAAKSSHAKPPGNAPLPTADRSEGRRVSLPVVVRCERPLGEAQAVEQRIGASELEGVGRAGLEPAVRRRR